MTVPETAGGCGECRGKSRRAPRARHGRSTERSPASHEDVTRLASRDGERGKSTLPCVLDNTHDRVAWYRAIARYARCVDPAPIGAQIDNAFSGP